MQQCYQIRPEWNVNAFIVDDALDEMSALRELLYSYAAIYLAFILRISHLNAFNMVVGSHGVKSSCVFGMYGGCGKNMNNLVYNKEKENDMFNDL